LARLMQVKVPRANARGRGCCIRSLIRRRAVHAVQVVLFAAAKDAAGTPELQLDLKDGASTGDVVEALTKQFPQLERILPRCALAVNGEYVQDAEPGLSPGDEIALLPPMSGG